MLGRVREGTHEVCIEVERWCARNMVWVQESAQECDGGRVQVRKGLWSVQGCKRGRLRVGKDVQMGANGYHKHREHRRGTLITVTCDFPFWLPH